MVHLRRTSYAPDSGKELATEEQHFCESCADTYFASAPGMNSRRKLICLSDAYRSRLYDLLEAAHPEEFDNHDTEACRRSSELMTTFLREQLKKDKVEVSGDAFDMLCLDFFGSHHFYTRQDEYHERNSNPAAAVDVLVSLRLLTLHHWRRI